MAKYQLVVKETYKGGPSAREELNYYVERTYESLDEIIKDVENFSKRVRLELISQESFIGLNKVSKKEFFKARNGHGRICRTYDISKAYVQIREPNSLI